jgi:hypothetical protein
MSTVWWNVEEQCWMSGGGLVDEPHYPYTLENFLNHLMKINGRINEKVFLISCLILSSCLSKEPVKEIVVKESKIVEVERITFK